MSWLGKYWKVLLAIGLLIAAVLVFVRLYIPERAAYEVQSEMAEVLKTALRSSIQDQIAENEELASIQDDVGPALSEIEAALDELVADRETLYGNFPGDLLEEDQILYVMDLEDILDMEVMFGHTYNNRSRSYTPDPTFVFGDVIPLTRLSDGAILEYVPIRVDFDMGYYDFLEMLDFLSQDERITTINYGVLDYDQSTMHVVGYATMMYYCLDAVKYEAPVIEEQAGKNNLFR